MNGGIQISQTQKVAVGGDVLFELPPDFLDGIELMAAVGGQIHEVEAWLPGQPSQERLAEWIEALSTMTKIKPVV